MDQNSFTALQEIGRAVVGSRRPWESGAPKLPNETEGALVASFRLARKRQDAGLSGQCQDARILLRSELCRLRRDILPSVRRVDVEELFSSGFPSTLRVCVVGVARPLPGGSLGVGDPGSGVCIEVPELDKGFARGSPLEVAGKWDAQLRRFRNAEIVNCRLLSGVSDWRRNFPGKSAYATSRPTEPASLFEATHILENARSRREISLGALCRVHSLLVQTPVGLRGKLRDGPAVVRLDGQSPFVPPPSTEARSRTEELLTVLERHLASGGNVVSAPVLAAETVARLTDLHPFADGNGRVARAVATWLLQRAGYSSKPNPSLDQFCSTYRHEHYLTLRHHGRDPWSWYQFFFDAVLVCFSPPKSTNAPSAN